MRITKVPQRKPTEPPPPLKSFIQSLETCLVDEITGHVFNFGEWNFPRSDLYLWVSVLNRFDDLLSEVVKVGDFSHMQSQPLSPSRRSCLLSILKFTRMLLENCSNRTLYASYEHLNELLCSHDLTIVEHTLWILLRSAQRASHQRSMRISLTVSHERLILLAQPLSSKDELMAPLLSKDYIVSDAMCGLDFSFYRSKPADQQPLLQQQPSDSLFSSVPSSNLETKQASLALPTPSSSFLTYTTQAEELAEGYIHLHVTPAEISIANSSSELVSKLVQQHKIPYPTKLSTSISSSTSATCLLHPNATLQQEGSHPVFALHRKIVIAANIHTLESRQQLILTRILALAAIVHILSEEQIYKVLPHDLVPDLVDIIGLDASHPWALKTASINALDGIALLRGKLQEVLVSLNASVSHGVLLSIVRRVIHYLISSENPLTSSPLFLEPKDVSGVTSTSSTFMSLSGDYFDALHSLLSHFMTLQNSGSMLLNAGLMSVLVQSLDCLVPHLKYASKLITMIDSIVYGFPNGFSIFCNCQGLTKLILRIRDEVLLLDSPEYDQLERINWFKSLLKFTLHMMQTVSAPEVRNLIDSSLPHSLLKIFESMKFTSLVSIAVNIMSNFIHCEPTSLAILQEMKLPQTLVDQVSFKIPASADLLLTLPNAFGAISLNHPGLDYFSESNALPSFLNIFLSPEHLPILVENDHATILGGGMDELLRHQPTIRPKVIDLLLQTLKSLVEKGLQSNPSVSLVLQDEQGKPPSSSPVDITMAIDAISKFLEGLFQSNSHPKEFLEKGGLYSLIQLFSFPSLTYDFPSSASSYSLLHLFRILCEIDPKQTSHVILTTLQNSLLKWQPTSVEMCLYPTLDTLPSANHAILHLTELLGLIKLLSEVYSPPSWPKRHPSLLLKELCDSFGMEWLMKLAELHQFCLAQLFYLRKAVSPKYFNEPKAKKSSGGGPNALTATSNSSISSEPNPPTSIPINITEPVATTTSTTTTNGTTISTNTATTSPTPPVASSLSHPSNNMNHSSATSNGHSTYILGSWGIPLLDEPLPTTDAIDETHYLFNNCRCLRTLFNQIHLSIVPLFHGISRMLTCKKNAEASVKHVNRYLAKSLVHVGQSYSNHTLATTDMDYQKQVLGLANLMFLNERNNSNLQTGLLYFSFEFNWFDQLAPSSDPVMVELFLHLLLCICNSKQVNESTFGVGLLEIPNFESSHLLQRARCFTIHFLEKNLDYIIAHTSCKTFLKIVTHLLKADGETPSNFSVRSRVGPIEDIFGSEMATLLRNVTSIQPPRQIVVDPTHVTLLTEMGFTQAVAHMALERCHNNVERAAEYILSHPELEFQAAAAASSSSHRASSTQTSSHSHSENAATTTVGLSSESLVASLPSDPTVPSSSSSSLNSSSRSVDIPQCELAVRGDQEMETDVAPMEGIESESTSLLTRQDDGIVVTPSVIDSIPSSTLEPSYLNGETLQKELQEARSQFQSKIMPLLVPILGAHEGLMMEFKDIIMLLGENEGILYLFQNMQTHLPVFLTLIALMFTDSSKHKLVLTHVLEHQKTFLDILTHSSTSPLPELGPIWVPLLLIFEGLFNYLDEPEVMETPKIVNDEMKVSPPTIEHKLQVQAVFPTSVLTTLVGQLSNVLQQVPRKPSNIGISTLPSSTSSTNSTSSLNDVIAAAAAAATAAASTTSEGTTNTKNQEKAIKMVTDSVLRLLVRLTRNSELCHVFVKEVGSPVEVLSKCESLHYVVMILRHIVEHSHPLVLPFVMCNEIKKSVIKSTLHPELNRDLDVNTLMKTCSHASLRNTALFLESTEKLFTASKPDVNIRNIPLKWVVPSYPCPSPSATISAAMETLVHQLMGLKNTDDGTGENQVHAARIFLMKMTSELVLSYTPCKMALLDFVPPSPSSSSSSSSSSSTATISASASSSSSNLNATKKHGTHPSTSHPSSSTPSSSTTTSPTSLVSPPLTSNASTPFKMNPPFSINTNSSVTTVKSAYITYLVEHVLPWPGVHTQTDLSITIRKKLFESQWASTILSCLCVNPDGDESEKDLHAPIHLIRKVVVDSVHKAMSTPFKGSVDARYGRYLALADTVHRMLTVPSKRRTLSGTGNSNAHAAEVVPIALVKCFLEKQFVALLTEMLAKIDTHHPQAKFIVTSILKPIEFLTKLSVKMSQVKFSSSIMVTPETPGRSTTTPAEEASRGAAEHALRHSSLGIMEGHDDVSMREEEHEEDEDEDEEDEEDGHESYNEVSTVELSDASELSEEEEEDGLELDMEIVIQPNHPHELLAEHEEEESNDLRRRRRHIRCMLRSTHSESSGPEDDDEEEDTEDSEDDRDEDEDDEIEESDPMDVDHQDEHGDGSDEEEGDSEFSHSYHSLSEHEGEEGLEMEIEVEDDDNAQRTGSHPGHRNEESDPNHPHHVAEDDDEEEDDGDFNVRERANMRHGSREADDDDMNSTDEAFEGEEEEEEPVDVLNDPFELELELPQTEDGSHPLDFRRALHDGHDHDYDEEEGDDADEEGLDTAEEDYLLHAGHDWFQTLSPHYTTISNSRRILMEDPNRFHQDLLHPLLSSNRNNGHLFLSLPTPRDRGQITLDSHQSLGAAVEQMLGGDAMPLLEQLFARASHAGSLEIQLNSDLFSERRIVINNNDPIVNDFKPLLTQERWAFEARLLFGNAVPEKNSRMMAHLAKFFLPQALQLKRAKDEAEKLQKEKEAKLAEEKKLKEQQEAKEGRLGETKSSDAKAIRTPTFAAMTSTDNVPPSTSTVAISQTTGDSPALDPSTTQTTPQGREEIFYPSTDTPSTTSPPYIVYINGEHFDLTDSGIDPTFIEALPEELRLEVIQQYILESGSVRPEPIHPTTTTTNTTNISSSSSTSSTSAASSTSSSSSSSSSVTSTTLSSMLSPATVGSSLPTTQTFPRRSVSSTSARTADTEVLYSPSYSDPNHPESLFFSDRSTALSTMNASMDTATAGVSEKKPEQGNMSISVPKKKDALHLLDRIHISTLVGLLFTEVPFVKGNLQKLLLSLCENTKTRNDLLSLLMQILNQGLEQVRLELQSIDRLPPSTVTERCLEMLVFLVRQSPPISHYFVLAKKHLPPILDLIDLLDSTHYVEELIELLSVIAQNTMDQPINLPKSAIVSLFNVLEGECPLKTFQHLLVVIQSLSRANFEGFVEVLIHSITNTRDALFNDLALLHTTLTSQSLEDNVLKSFSHPASQQARLLRLLKTLDYLVVKQKKPMPTVEVFKIWVQLSQCLSDIDGREELVSVLLPLIEAFMVVEAQTHDPSFNDFTEHHRKLLNVLVRNNPSLLSGSFSILVNNPKVLEFDNKRNYFYQQLNAQKTRRHNIGSLQLNVRRQFVFEDSFHQLQHKSGEEIKYGKLMVRFYDEEGVDAGGLTREWFSVLARQIFNPDYALFKTSAVDKVTYQPNRASWVNPEHLRFFKFVGRFIGKAIYDQRLLDCYFTRSFYKHMLGKLVDIRDMEAVDPSYYKSLEWILENDINDVIDLTFSVETEDFGRTKIVDLKENGRNIPVTDENKQEYVQLAVEQKLTKAIQEPIAAFLSGLQEIIPKDLLRIFNEHELELLISGMPEIDVDDWKNNTEYRNYTSSSPVIQWFWRAVRSFDQEQRAKLVQYCTGTSKVPLEGFKALQGSSGVQKFLIVKDPGGTHRLPSSHTCFNQLDLPEYESYEQLRTMALKAIDVASEGFGIS